jgi:hypothetical protein
MVCAVRQRCIIYEAAPHTYLSIHTLTSARRPPSSPIPAQIREPLLEADSSGVLGYLMHYPDMPSVTPVIDYADMIKRCVRVHGRVLCVVTVDSALASVHRIRRQHKWALLHLEFMRRQCAGSHMECLHV